MKKKIKDLTLEDKVWKALETIKNITILEDYEDKGLKRIVFASEVYEKQFNIIETALKRIPKLEKALKAEMEYSSMLNKQYLELAKILRIIKRIVKIVDYSDHTIENGNLIILQGGEIKTKEEFDLLKKWLK